MRQIVCLAVICLTLGGLVSAQDLTFRIAAAMDDGELARTMPRLAGEIIARYAEADRNTYLDNLFRLRLVAGDYGGAKAAIRSLREIRKATDPSNASFIYLQYEIFAEARILQAAGGAPFEDAFRRSFREAYGRLADLSAVRASSALRRDPGQDEAALREALEPLKGKDRIGLKEALGLVRAYQPYAVYKAIAPLTEALRIEDENRRYIIQDDVPIRTKDGAVLSAIVVRKRGVAEPRPAALVFTIYADHAGNISEPKEAAARGYVGVVAFTRGKGTSPGPVVPYELEARDTTAVIDWISRQPWSDGRVGMYGGSYNGFACWAAAKVMHPALATIVPYAANNPGDGLPMENNIFLFVNYPWAFYVTDNKYLDEKLYSDRARWNSLNDRWYASGRPYREVDAVDGTPNPWYQRWLKHPGYDAYWQGMLPYKEEFARIDIPVLTITGYYDDGQGSAVSFLKDHVAYNSRADHFLLIGPYDHFGAQASRKEAVLRGYAIDPVAQIDTPEITFQWLDYVMRGGPRPALLGDKINYEVMGANVWKHAPSLPKMADQALTLYLTDTKAGASYRLSPDRPSRPGYLSETVDFADRKTTNNNDSYPAPILGKTPDLSRGLSFLSEPFGAPVEIAGAFSGVIKAVINKKDMDIGIVLYEVMPDGRLFHLSYFLGRASYARDMSVRRLLTPGREESIPFDKSRLVCRRLAKGSRLLVTLDVNKNPYAQINYGTGKDVSDEDIRDAKIPLEVRWLNDSFVRIPVRK